jgi:uncharacterized protein YecE (DUF72 family)
MFQVPHNLKFDAPLFGTFLQQLAPGLDNVVEFRHASWLNDETYALLRAHQVALCVTEGTDELSTPDIATAPFKYYRFRREDYGPDRIKALAAQFRAAEATNYVYFKHEDTPDGALHAVSLLNLASSV